MKMKNQDRGRGRGAASGRFVDVKVGERSVKIMGALNNKKYKARTIDGIAKEIGANRVDVITTIKSDPSLLENMKVYRRRSSDGKMLITTKDRFSKEADFKDKFIDVFSSRGVTLDDN